MYFIHQVNVVADLSKFILGINKDQALFAAISFPLANKFQCIIVKYIPFSFCCQALCNNFFRGNIFIMPSLPLWKG